MGSILTSKLERELAFRFPTSYSSDELLKLDTDARYIAEVDRLQRCEDALRFLAAMVAAGGYNALTVDPDVFKEKIIWGIRELSKLGRSFEAGIAAINETPKS